MFKGQDVAVVLEDGDGHRALVDAADIGVKALAYPIGPGGSGHYILNQVRFPLAAFAGVDLTDIRAVEISFDRTSAGVIDVADALFARGGV
jgi:hypothetical protein